MGESTEIPTAPISPLPSEHTAMPPTAGFIVAASESNPHATSGPSLRRQGGVVILPNSYDESESTASRVPSAPNPAGRGATAAKGGSSSAERRQSRGKKGTAKGNEGTSSAKRPSATSPVTTRSLSAATASPTRQSSGLKRLASSTRTSSSQREGGRSTSITGARKGRRSLSKAAGKPRASSGSGRREKTLGKDRRGSSARQQRSIDMGKKKGKKSLQTLINTEEKLRVNIDAEYEASWKDMMIEIAIDSFEPQRRNILQAQEELCKVRRECDSAMTRAENALKRLIKCTSHFVQTARATGVDLLREEQILELDVPHATPNITTEEEILSCARDPSSYLTESHVPVKKKDAEEEDEIARIGQFFLELTQQLEVAVSITENNFVLTVEQAGDVEKNTAMLTSSFSFLIQRVKRLIEQRRQQMALMQGVINEQATRTKVADDFLRETTAKHRVEVESAIQVCREFGMELRQRMAALEKDVLDNLNDLIQRSTEVSIENNAFHDHAQLLLNKESTIQRYMSKMETVTVEQGKLLRDVRLRLLQLWKERCGEGDEERSTLTHSGLPKMYHTALEACDRDTLLRLLHYVSLNSDDVPALLISALDEHESFIKGNTEEAREVAEQSATEAAVRAIIEKLYEEGDIKSNTRPCSASIADAINDMVRRYNTYMTGLDKKERRAARRKDMEKLFPPYPFFDSRTPVPEEYAAEIASRPPLQRKRPAICDGNASRMQPDITTPTFEGGSVTLPGINPNKKEDNSNLAQTLTETCHVLRYLRQSHPSALEPPGTATVVGFGRWGGKLAKRGADTRAYSAGGGDVGGGGDGTNAPSAQDNAEAIRCATWSGPHPPPRVPPRVSIMQHVLEHHRHDVNTLPDPPQLQCRLFPGEDAPFLKQQRVLFESN
ncbi:hypothetical protein MOQ_002615 [Trypanosoma cruzi marinkellei]|uniref:Uncharacterized protein n=1 Tax=Trypanosoma cruzi marinkellei TaxID=85056 RepID=K2NXB8_TRYCR|nr:hypothetical protein MOQ_002615 [Trypanosoma cruzi marinkellei]